MKRSEVVELISRYIDGRNTESIDDDDLRIVSSGLLDILLEAGMVPPPRTVENKVYEWDDIHWTQINPYENAKYKIIKEKEYSWEPE